MVGQILLSLSGTALLLLGIGATGAGLVRAWRQYRPEDQILDPVRSRLDRSLIMIAGAVRSILRLPRKTKVHYASAAATVTVSALGGRLTKSYNPIDGREPGSAEFAMELDRRIQDTRGEFNEFVAEYDQAERVTNDRVVQLERDVAAHKASQREENCSLATGGVRIAVFGLVLTGLGIVLQAIGTIIGATSI